MSVSDDKLKIPIEIKTDDLDEIRKLINEITQAESDLHTIKATPRRGKGTGDTTSKSAFTRPDEDLGGIFGQREGDVLPQKGRDRVSKAPIHKENQCKKLQDDVAAAKKEQVDVQGGLGLAIQVAALAQ